jgi:tetratricopeptide (TPR) repeat protein
MWWRERSAGSALMSGRWDDALRHIDELDRPQDAIVMRGIIRLGRGDIDGAIDDACLALEEAPTHGRPDEVAAALALHAWALQKRGRVQDADAAADTLSELVLKNPLSILTAVPAISVVLVEFGRGDLVLSALADLKVPAVVEVARLYASGEFVSAADEYERLDRAFLAAHARLRAAEVLLDERRRDEADAQLNRALALFRAAGATAFIREGEALLAAAT